MREKKERKRKRERDREKRFKERFHIFSEMWIEKQQQRTERIK